MPFTDRQHHFYSSSPIPSIHPNPSINMQCQITTTTTTLRTTRTASAAAGATTPSNNTRSNNKSPRLLVLCPAVIGLVFLLILATSITSTTNGFILQELPLYRSTRDFEPLAASMAEGAPMLSASALEQMAAAAAHFARPTRAFNFQRLNRLQNYWNRNDALRRWADQPRGWMALANSRRPAGSGMDGAFWKK